MKPFIRILGAALIAACAAVPVSAQKAGAGDGVVTIDQTKAINGNVTPGDAAGFPVTISQPGSYRLTSNLIVTDPTATAVVITASNVTLDLNGFTISGPNTCAPNPGGPVPTCKYAYNVNADGIVMQAPLGATVRNGVVRGFAAVGVNLPNPGSRVEDLLATENTYGGVLVASSGLVTQVVSRMNGGYGIYASSSVVADSVAEANGGSGFTILAGSLLRGGASRNNGQWAVSGSSSSGAREVVMMSNGGAYLHSVSSLGNNLCGGVPC